MKGKLKTEGLTGDNLNFVNQLNNLLADLPDGMTKADVATEINAMFKSYSGEDGKWTFVTKAELEALVSDDTKPDSLRAIVKEQGAQIRALKEKDKDEQVKSLTQILEEKKEEFVKMVKAKQSAEFVITDDIVHKAATTTAISFGGSVSSSLTTGTTLRLGDGPFFEIKRNVPFVLDFVNVGETNQAYLIWWDEVAKQGDFAITAEGALKPLVQYEFIRRSADYKKAAGYSVLTEEFMNDMPQLVSNIKRLGNIDMMLAINTQIYADLIAVVPTFTFTGLNGKIYHADDYAAIGAAICQIQSFFFTPTVLVMNPADLWKMKLTKDDVGRYQMPPFSFNGETYEFGTIIVNPAVAIGHFLVGEGNTFNVDMKGGVIIRIGYNGTDFIQNQMTLVVEQYYFDYISNNRLNAWVYGWFDLIKGAINDNTNS